MERPDELYSLTDPRYGVPVMSFPNYVDVRDRNTAFAGVVGYRIAPVNASLGAGANSRMGSYLVTGNYFEVLGARRSAGGCCLRPMTSRGADIGLPSFSTRVGRRVLAGRLTWWAAPSS